MYFLKDNYTDTNRGQFTGPLFFGSKQIFLLLIIVLVGIFSWYWLSQQVLIIEPISSSDEKIIIPLNDPKWHLSYTHSVQKTVVDECFEIQKNNTFSMYRTRYSSFGVGLPFLPNEGELTFLPNKTMQLDLKHPRIFPVVKLWTGVEAKVNLITDNNILSLYEQYPTGTLVQISTGKRYQVYFNR